MITRQLVAASQLQTGDIASAVKGYEEAVRLDNETLLTKGMLCHAYGIAGRRDDAAKLLSEIDGGGEPRDRGFHRLFAAAGRYLGPGPWRSPLDRDTSRREPRGFSWERQEGGRPLVGNRSERGSPRCDID